MKTAVHSEIAPLEAIVTSPPGLEFDLMLPENLEAHRPGPDGRLVPSPDYLLFDDLVLLSAMQAEHAQLVEVVRAVTGHRNHYTWRQLLVETLGEPEVRREVIHRTLELEDRLYPHKAAERDAIHGALEDLDAPRLAEALILGRHPVDRRPLYRWPMPNALFARDLMAAVGDSVVMTYAAEPARGREMLLSRMILRYHQAFRGIDKVDIGDDAHGRPKLSVEGGDIQVIGDKTVLIGVGIRTTMEAVDALAPKLFARGIETVLCYEMPRRRAAMHIDTLFTRIDENHCLIYPPLVEDPQRLGARVHRITPAEGRVDAGPALLPVLAYHGINLQPVYCGGSNPIMQAREQWSDGANAFALAPGVIVCYGRNRYTLRQLNRIGYEVVSTEQFVDNALYYVSQGRKIVVALHGHELVRGRGGPRCLTLPLRRRAIEA